MHTGLKRTHSADTTLAGPVPNETYLYATGVIEIRPLLKPQPYRHSTTITLVRPLNASTLIRYADVTDKSLLLLQSA